MGKVLTAVAIIFLLFGVFRQPILDGIKAWRTNDENQTALVTTAGGVTSANVTLSFNLFQAALANIEGITSSTSGDTAAATAYDEESKALTVGGLAPGVTRTLTIHYLAETDDSVMLIVGPFLAIFIFGFLLWLTFAHSKKRGG